ncbi:dihydrofolate reductase [Halodesulfurarchaeum sp. HSR-GB]|uniref:dihydrofolate reductase n=1 Tax=Halodesulfurarchaeum sp. HSR-GB TaxID=3074077 RepID=UPI00285D8F58|nr:dihydrofolate reductase [Halodesulfurarchaeum sp. HSR-GB]MDR5656120.1 dihydrofolate reductase [Halodesulfurarchaeum sp. HSR-GB]
MKIALIAAVAENGVIGDSKSIPWHYPADLKHFKECTVSHPVIMGRRTYEAIVDRLGEPLPDRLNVVLSTNGIDVLDGAVQANSIPEAIEIAAATDAEIAFVAGGGSIYEQFLPRADRLYITEIPETPPGDTHFPEWDRDRWELIEQEERGDLVFSTYERSR